MSIHVQESRTFMVITSLYVVILTCNKDIPLVITCQIQRVVPLGSVPKNTRTLQDT